MRTRLRRPKEVEVLPQLLDAKLRGEDRPLLPQRREPLRLSRLHALSLVGFRGHGGGGGEGRRRGDAGGNGGGAERCSLGFEKKGGAAEVREDGVVATSKGERTAPVSSAYKEGRGGRFALPNKEPPTISPTMPHSMRAVRGERGGYRARFGVAQSACARALSWAWPNSARHRVWPRPGGSCRCTRIGVP